MFLDYTKVASSPSFATSLRPRGPWILGFLQQKGCNPRPMPLLAPRSVASLLLRFLVTKTPKYQQPGPQHQI